MSLELLGALQLWDPAWGPEPSAQDAASATPPAGLTPKQQAIWQAWKAGKMDQTNVKGDPSALDSSSWSDFLPNLLRLGSVAIPRSVKVAAGVLGVVALGVLGLKVLR